MAEYVWNNREALILEAIAEAEESGGDVSAAARNSVTLDNQLYGRTINSLHEDGYIHATVMRSGGGYFNVHVNRLLPRGKRAVGQWPSDPGELLLQAVAAALESTSDPDEKSKLRTVLSALKELGQGVITEVATGLIKGAAGIP